MRNLRRKLRSAYAAEPVIINALVTFGVAVAARYGFDLDAEWLIAILFGASTLATRRTVVSPATAAKAVASATPEPPAVIEPMQPELPFGPIGQ